MSTETNPRIWVYGFEPFLHYSHNITQQVVEALPTYQNVRAAVLPVRFEANIFAEPVQKYRPHWVLGMGQYPRGKKIRIERKAYNGQRDKGQSGEAAELKTIRAQGPESYHPSWRIPRDEYSWYSYDAGRYVCNFSMYCLSHLAHQHNFNYAFIHIPRQLSLELALSFVTKQLENRGAYT